MNTGGISLNRKWFNLLIGFIIIYGLLHITPHMAIRTHLVTMGYPNIAFTTGIVDDEFHNEVDKLALHKDKAKCYTITKPAYEKATDGYLKNFKVKRAGLLHFASYYGDF